MFQALLFIGIVITVICLCKHQEKVVYDNKVKEINDFKVKCAKTGNRSLLKELGDEKFARLYGEDQLNLVKNNRDTKLVVSKMDWERKANGGSSQYK